MNNHCNQHIEIRGSILDDASRAEVFEVIVSAQGHSQIIYFKRFEFGESLIALIDLDLDTGFEKILNTSSLIKANIRARDISALSANIEELVSFSHPFFCELIGLLIETTEELEAVVGRFLEQMKIVQKEAIMLATSVLNPHNMFSDYTTAEALNDFQFMIPNEPIQTTARPVKLSYLAESANKSEMIAIARTCYSKMSFDLYRFFRNEYVLGRLKIKTCKNCSKFFVTKDYVGLEYCNRLSPGSSLTCRAIGPTRIYQNRQKMNPIMREYTRAYRTHNARIRYGIINKEEFKRWSAEARQRRDMCLAGKMPFEDFVAWLDSDKEK